MRAHFRSIVVSLIALLMIVSILVPARTASATIVLNRYDVEQQLTGEGPFASGVPVTQAGWTHIDRTTAYTPTTGGMDLVNSHLSFAVDRGSSTQSPVDVTRDMLYGAGQSSLVNSTFAFRDIIPAWSQSVTITVWRSDPSDSFAPNYRTRVSINGAAETQIDAGIASNATYHPPLISTLTLTAVATTGTLDLRMYDPGAGSAVRIDGIEFSYFVPEPASAAVAIGAMGLVLIGRRRGC